MARPRKHVRIINQNGVAVRTDKKNDGKEVYGLHFNKANQTYYRYVDDNKEWLGRDLHIALMRVGFSEPSVTQFDARAISRSLPPGVSIETVRKLAAEAVRNAFGEDTAEVFEDTYRSQAGLPEVKRKRKRKPRGIHKLSHVRDIWKETKLQVSNGDETPHIKDTVRVINQFIKVVGNAYISNLTFDDFRKWQNWIIEQNESVHWQNCRNAWIKSVLKHVRRKTMDWNWPAEIMNWADAYDHHSYAPEEENSEPIPVDAFNALYQAAEARIQCDIGSIEDGRKKHWARMLAREGRQIKAALLLGIQAAFDPIDLTRLRKQDLHLDTSLPYVDLPRVKVKGKVGKAIKRCCPLLPVTVKALREWMDFDPIDDDLVFHNTKGGPYRKDTVGHTIERLRKEAGAIAAGWSFKHLRNAGPTLGRDADISQDLLNAFLGHHTRGVIKYYQGRRHAEAMLPIVELIDQVYLSSLTEQCNPCTPDEIQGLDWHPTGQQHTTINRHRFH